MRKLKIAICDNDEDELIFAKQGFEKSGYFDVMAIVESGDALIVLLDNLQNETLPDIILSDLNMPGKNGYDMLQILANDNRYARLPVYISSTSTSMLAKEKCIKLGAKEYLVKPDTYDKYDEFATTLYQKLLLKN